MARAAAFAADLKQYGKAVETGLARAVGEYSIQRYVALINAKHTGPNNPAPVLTGYSRSRWRITFGSSKLPEVSPPPRDPAQSYPVPRVPERSFKKLASTVITNDADYINEINGPHFIVDQADLKTAGLLEKLMARYVPR